MLKNPTYGKSKSNEIVVGCEPAVLEMILQIAISFKYWNIFQPFWVKSSTVKSVLVETFPARFYLHIFNNFAKWFLIILNTIDFPTLIAFSRKKSVKLFFSKFQIIPDPVLTNPKLVTDEISEDMASAKEELDQAVPFHTLLDVSANKSKAELAHKGILSQRQRPSQEALRASVLRKSVSTLSNASDSGFPVSSHSVEISGFFYHLDFIPMYQLQCKRKANFHFLYWIKPNDAMFKINMSWISKQCI